MVSQTSQDDTLEVIFKRTQEIAHNDATRTFLNFDVSSKFLEELSSVEKRTRDKFKIFFYINQFNYLNLKGYGANISVKMVSLVCLTLFSPLVSKILFDNFKLGFLLQLLFL